MSGALKRNPVGIRASSFSTLFDCPQRWLSIHLEGKKSPSNGKAALGTAIHAGTAVYDAEVLQTGQHCLGAITAATAAAVESLDNPTDEVVWDEKKSDAQKIAVMLTARYCREESPKHNFVAVEAKIEALLIEDLGIVLTGTTDRIKRTEHGLGICDIKSGKQAVLADGLANTKGHAAQLGIYELIAEASEGIDITAPAEVIGLQTNIKPENQRIGTAQVVGAREVLLGNEQQTGLLQMASRIVHGETEPWGNPKSTMCTNVYCPNFSTCFWRR